METEHTEVRLRITVEIETVEIDREDAELLSELAQCHYDHACKAHRTLYESWAQVAKNRQLWHESIDQLVFAIRLNFRLIDVTLKVLEIPIYSDKDKLARQVYLTKLFRRLLVTLQQAQSDAGRLVPEVLRVPLPPR